MCVVVDGLACKVPGTEDDVISFVVFYRPRLYFDAVCELSILGT